MRSTVDRRSVIHFSVNKAATQYVRRILVRCTEPLGLVPAHLNGYAFWSDLPYFDHPTASKATIERAFRPSGYLYSSFGGYVSGIPDVESYDKVLVVRDPRDVLTSQFFSISLSHQVPGADKRAAFLERRARAHELGIDAFVLERSAALASILDRYITELLPQPRVLLLRYEELVTQLPTFLEELCEFLHVRLETEVHAGILAQAQPAPGKEDPRSKVRQVTPGDHRRKLREETIERLGEVFATHLERFGYS